MMEREKIYKETKLVQGSDKAGIKDCAKHLCEGEVVAFPTETVYGLGANAFDAEAVTRIFAAKGRPSDNPLICHVGDKSQIEGIVSEITPLAQKLIDAFMPGPITVIMKKSDKIPSEVTAGLDTVGVRMPSDPVANAFLKACKVPVAAPSANLSGTPSPTNARAVMEDMDGYVYAVIDGGDSVFGLESTVVDATGEKPVILRPGAVTKADVEDCANGDAAYAGTLEAGQTPKAPGMKYRHYAPFANVEIMDMPKDAKLVGDEGENAAAAEAKLPDFAKMSEDDRQALVDIASPFIHRERELLKANPFARIGIFAGIEVKALYEKLGDKVLLVHTEFYEYGNALDVRAASHSLFEGLRHLDCQEVDVILAQGLTGGGMATAYMNRLSKAAGKKGELLPGMPKPERPSRNELPLEAFDDTYTAQILFVDDDNTCLSQVCDAVMTQLIERNSPYETLVSRKIGCEIYVESAGITASDGAKCDADVVKAVSEVLGRNVSHCRSTRTDPALYDASDLIITVRDEHAFEICKAFPQIKEKVFSLSSFAASCGLVFKDANGRTVSISIPDPRGENEATYMHTVKALKAWLEVLFPYLIKALGADRA
ncbi:MAG: threonylcarbamoyl-AMP synthase [Clostridiales bacterium]|nr:threonylcarbamoyl-AMP synthase [Clostridiales bacterium]